MSELKTQRIFLLAVAVAVVIVIGQFIVFSVIAGQAEQPIEKDANTNSPAVVPTTANGVQDIYIKALGTGTYDKTSVTVKKGVPVKLHFSAEKNAGCGRAMVIYGLNVKAISRGDEEQVVEFTPQKEGTYEYNCGMRMFRGGKLRVIP